MLQAQHLPLVSILIPTFNRVHFFKFAIDSALRQTYPNIEIIVTDNSTDHATENFIQPLLKDHPRIKYVRNRENIGPVLNFIKAYELSKGEYINFLMDDDVFHPEKIEKMMVHFLKDAKKEITLITSYRKFIDENGHLLPDNYLNRQRYPYVAVLGQSEGGDPIISEFNWIGVPSTTLFRREALGPQEAFGTFSGRLYRCGVDCAAWLTLLKKGKMIYLPEALSYVRLHSGGAGQNQNPVMSMHASLDMMHMLFHSRKNGYLLSDNEWMKAIGMIETHLKYMKTWPSLDPLQKQEITHYLNCLDVLKLNRDVSP